MNEGMKGRTWVTAWKYRL